MFALLMTILNISLTIVAFLGIYNFSNSYIWAIIGSFLLTGSSMQINPLIALIGYPLIEFIFSGKLTIYSLIYISIIVIQFLLCMILAKNMDN